MRTLSRALFNAHSPFILIGISAVSGRVHHFMLYFYFVSVFLVSLLSCLLLDFSLHYFIHLFLLLTLTMIT